MIRLHNLLVKMTIKSHGAKQRTQELCSSNLYILFLTRSWKWKPCHLLTKYKTHPIPDSSDFQRTREDSKTSMEKTAPDMAPIAAPRMKPLSVSWPIKAPVIAPNKVPTANITNNPLNLISLKYCHSLEFQNKNYKKKKNLWFQMILKIYTRQRRVKCTQTSGDSGNGHKTRHVKNICQFHTHQHIKIVEKNKWNRKRNKNL